MSIPYMPYDYYDAVVYNNEIYCTGCLPDGVDERSEEVRPIYAIDEWRETYPVCDVCHWAHDYITFVPMDVKEEDRPVLTISYNANCRDTAIEKGGADFIEGDTTLGDDQIFCDLCGRILHGYYWLCLDGGECYCEDCIIDADEV